MTYANPTKLRTATAVGSRVEEDDFVVNDVPLVIPPEQITVQKDSFMNEWQTLRTSGSRRAKSGHSLVNVSFSAVFHDNDSINHRLRPLIAGLRAFPFCTVHNKYLYDQLAELHNQTQKTYQQFTPVVLALTSATVSTVPRKPGVLYGQFNFMWFNYYPYTPIWAYKSGDDYESPGPVWQSEIWRQFYKPYLDLTDTVDWPHLDPSANPCYLRYREFQARWNGDVNSTKAASELVNILKNKPTQALGTLKDVMGKTTTTMDNALTRWYQALVDQNLISKQNAIDLSKIHEGGLEKSAGDIVYPLLRNIYSQTHTSLGPVGTSNPSYVFSPHGLPTPVAGTADLNRKAKIKQRDLQIRTVVQGNLANIKSAGAELSNRYKRAAETAAANKDTFWEEIEEFGNEIVFNSKAKTKIDVGGFKVYGRKRHVKIRPVDPSGLGAQDPGYVLEGLSISFIPNLSVVPLIGHNHPTCQFTGGYDTELSITVNANNGMVKQLSQAYDRWENSNLKYRRIPQSFRNLTVDCDFVKLFGVNEYLPKSFHQSTIPEQPGRSRAVLSLVDAGITSTDQLEDPELLKQEFVANDPALRKEIFNVLMKNLAYQGGEDWYIVKFAANADLRNRAFGDLTIGVATLINDFVAVKAMPKLFLSGGGYAGTEAEYTYSDLMRLGNTEDSVFGYIPGLEHIQKTIKTVRDRGPDKSKSLASRSHTNIKKSIRRRDFKNYLEGKPEGGADVDYPANSTALEDVKIKAINRLRELGLHKYQQGMNALLDKIASGPLLDLPQFQHLKATRDSSGVGKGKLAYPDFKRSLRNVASFLDATSTDAGLIDYDPDIFMWYPFLNGSLQNPVTGVIIDDFLISQAKQHSQKIFDRAQGDVGDFFQGVYRRKLSGGLNQAPIKALDHYSKGKLAEPLYKQSSYKNTLLNPGEAGDGHIQVTTVPDPAKVPTNYYGDVKPALLCNDSITHSTDLEDLWGNVQTETGNAAQNKDNTQHESVQPEEHGAALVHCQADPRWGVLPLAYEWPMSRSSQGPTSGLVCPVETYRSILRAGSLGTRDIGRTGAGWDYRKKAAVRDWKNVNARLVRDGYYDPNKASKHFKIRGKSYFGKPVSKWTYAEYINWKKTTGKKLGYVHKGLDLMASIGTKVYAIADGVVQYAGSKPVRGAGFYVEVKHPSRPNGIALSRYLHLQAVNPALRRSKRVKAGDVIGVVGKSGQRSMKPHLHFECWAGRYLHSQVLDPLEVSIPYVKGRSSRVPMSGAQRRRLSQLAQQNLQKDVTTSLSSPLRTAIEDFEKRLLKGQAQRIIRALPTFKLYFIEDDSGQRNRLGFDDFFSYNAVKSIKVVKSRKIAADVCIIEMTNVSGVLSNRKYRHEADGDKPRNAKGELVEETNANNNPGKADTLSENPIASLMLQQGMDIHLKLGYSSDPDLLEPVFTGRIQIVEFSETDDFVTVVAQSHATELAQDIKCIDKPKQKETFGLGNWNFWGFNDNATTGRIFEEMLAQPEVIHFGRWERGDSTANRELLTNKYQFVPTPADDNIFAPPPSVDLETIGTGFLFKHISYFMYRTTIWEIFKEMEMRHPNFIGSPVPYSAGGGGERMTYFFGLPNQLYFSRAPKPNEQNAQNKIEQDEKNIQSQLTKQIMKATKLKNMVTASNVFRGTLPSNEFLEGAEIIATAVYNTSPIGRAIRKTVNEVYRKKRLLLAKEAGYIKPFRNYHLFTSNSHIVANNIRADGRDVANTIAVRYPSAVIKRSWTGQTSVAETQETFILKLDNALPTEDIRTQIGDFPNIKNEELAKRYALTMLCRNLKDVYKGDIVVIGEPTVKPYDCCFLFDEVSDITGPIEVEQVIHSLDRDRGYICEITPDMCVMASEWSLLGSLEALSIVMEGVIKKMWGRSTVDNSRGQDPQFSPWSFMLAGAVQLTGGMMAKKIINYTQLGQPVIMAPLLHHGREFSGGVPTRKIPTSVWDTMFGEWKPEADESYHAWLEDVTDNMNKSIKKYTGGYSVGSVLDGWSANTVDND